MKTIYSRSAHASISGGFSIQVGQRGIYILIEKNAQPPQDRKRMRLRCPVHSPTDEPQEDRLMKIVCLERERSKSINSTCRTVLNSQQIHFVQQNQYMEMPVRQRFIEGDPTTRRVRAGSRAVAIAEAVGSREVQVVTDAWRPL
ncbi:hypothetical protein Y032_0150g2766 [Ancylostoma ceylanicum]|uniref:Uncharacterized protein n=1 Tax=Ancylostoma ceylanicum TaxID=53326 RepID=A0A016T1E7_9BILA|nr:hypothetical protein Y032_0150g2766 [Ancylostoma ceylanicum]